MPRSDDGEKRESYSLRFETACPSQGMQASDTVAQMRTRRCERINSQVDTDEANVQAQP